ncbi:MAG: L-seryl-tRNA(Sec) selenium transferase [Firmicutes bacterium]|nr:L-seryl-tRNA(Sec) selenium transferase [Bacillota bacterium]
MDKRKLFSKLPKVDDILSNKKIKDLIENIPRDIVVETVREEIEKIRKGILENKYTLDNLDEDVKKIYNSIIKRSNIKINLKLKKVINATGTVIHTNLGRSLISEEIMENIKEVSSNYSNLEYDLDKGMRGSRYSHIEDIIKRITGAEAAMVVNNNAAAVMLVLSTIAKEKEVVVSRGELVEIGGSFRVPDVMEQSGAKLVDVGTTNKTHNSDYETAIGEETAALLKVHTSNYRIVGFTKTVELDDLVNIGRKYDVPVIEDIGSGVLIDLSKYGLQYEPTVQESLKAGVDIVTFSGDKLLGGPQGGIIVGKKKYIDKMKRNPLTRAIRVDKFTISALEATLKLYLNEKDALKKIPTLNMITQSLNKLDEKASKLYGMLESKNENINLEIVDQYSQVGGGAMPLEEIPTKAIMIYSDEINVSVIENKLREFKIPIITRIYKDRMYLDLRTINEKDFNNIVDGFKYALKQDK